MGFNRNNYIRIKEEYNGKYRRAEEAAKLRRAEVELAIPKVSEINKKLSLTGIEIMEAAMKNDMAAVDNIRKKNDELLSERAKLLEGA